MRPMPLISVKEGSCVQIKRIDAGEGLTKRLTDIGLVPKAELIVISNPKNGPFIISIKGSRFVLGYGIAQKIIVT